MAPKEKAAKGKAQKERPGNVAVKEKAVHPEIPTNADYRRQLREDLKQMGCIGFYNQPWDLQKPSMLKEVAMGKRPAKFAEDLVRGQPRVWERSVWKATYKFISSEVGYISVREDEEVQRCVSQPAHEHDGFKVEHCLCGTNSLFTRAWAHLGPRGGAHETSPSKQWTKDCV